MPYRVHRYNYNKSAEQRVVEGVLKVLWWLISAPFRLIFRRKNPGVYQQPENISLDREFVRNKWQEISELMALGGPSNFQRAVLEADKLLDHLLKGHRAPGLTMGDRLKASRNKFTSDGYDSAWQGHKIRNEIVHNADYPITDFVAKKALENFKKAIGELI